MISVAQIKAARGLLEWNQADLADASGLHLNAINNVERRHGIPRGETIAAIQNAFEKNGVRFKGMSGIELVQETLDIKKYAGADFIRVMTDDVLSTMTNAEDELIAVLPDERLFLEDEKQNDRYYLAQKKIGFKQRIILSQEDGMSWAKSDEVRHLPEAVLGKISYQVYGDRFVLMNWQSREVVMIRSETLAFSFRNQFNYLWEQATQYQNKKL